ncbi:hypothetical protein IAG44_23830 [Streptomyces roseirectus]|uniref:Flp pilus assembly protein RcpC/CpaB domain-containing protein n=1 Tax=Streptomyces roseirectus TaxID=2768066 RepID=A0A7H0IH77_9ACTN|nr:hypothetical protein [Streptomyces roseirectus]QNP72143.1 hypothetical protein IAG44_23830 [Streptomyces roseirectus]
MSVPPPPPSSEVCPPGSDTPVTCEVPHFSPVRVRGARYQWQRLVRHRRRALALGLAVTAAALVAAGPQDGAQSTAQAADSARGRPEDAGLAAAPPGRRASVETVSAPVRIADAETVRLLRPGDRVDVIAAEQAAAGGGEARVVARGALVSKVPEPLGESPDSGALVVLAVPRKAAAQLAGAGATARLAVTLW